MIFNRLEMQNFKSHKNTTINLGQGTTLILGENGAGKSTILEAISYALYKTYTGKAEEIIRQTTQTPNPKMMIRLTFTHNGNTYTVERTRQYNKSQSKIYNESMITIAEGESTVNKTIQEILAMDNSTFLNAIYIKQGEISDLITKTPSERKKIIGKLIKIDDLEKAYNNSKTIIQHYQNRKDSLEKIIKDKEELQKKSEKTETEKHRLERQITTLEDKIRKQKKRIDEATIESNKHEQAKNEILKIEMRIKHETQDLNQLKREKDTAEKKLQKTQEEMRNFLDEIYSKLEKDHNITERNISKLNKILDDETNSMLFQIDERQGTINDCEARFALAIQEIESIQKSIKELEKDGGSCPLCNAELTQEQKNKLIRKNNETIQIKQIEKAELNKRIIKLKDDVRELQKQRNRLETIYESILLKDNYSRLNILQNTIIENETIIKHKEDDIKTKKQRISSLKMELEGIGYEEDKGRTILLKKMNDEMLEDVEELAKSRTTLEWTNKQMHELEEEIKENNKNIDESKSLGEYIGLLEDFRTSYGKDGIQKELRMHFIPLIRKHMKDFFDKFHFNYDDVGLDEDYNIILSNGDMHVGLNMVSGGEQVAVALALRLGIAQALSNTRIESIMLDEPTIHLDSYRRQELVNVMNGMSSIPQMIIVTHDDELMNISDKNILVKKVDGVSSVL